MIILANRGEESKIIEEEKDEWVGEILDALGIPEVSNENAKEYLMSYGIEIWRHADGKIDIYKDDEIIAQWKNVEYVLIKDKPSYYKIHIDAWAKPLQTLEE